jgi:general secretion pathway protein J
MTSERGFTLIEVVLALTIFGLLTLLAYGAFFVGHRAVLKGEREADVNQRLRVVDDLIARQVRSAVFYFARHEDEVLPYFLGRQDGMSFVTAAPQGGNGTGLAVITYQVANGRFTVEERGIFTPNDLYEPPADARVERAVLFEDFSSIRFEYLAPEDTESNWQPTWDAREEEMLPAAVRLTVDGMESIGLLPWTRDIPLMTIAYGWGNEEFQEAPDDELWDSSEDGMDDADSGEEE